MGKCLFATMPISYGSVCEYKGTYMSRKEARSVKLPYVFDFRHDDRAVSIDASKHTETVGRYISHNRDFPNVVCQKVFEEIDDGRPHLIFFAKRDISIGEEISYEYGDFSQESTDNHSWLGKPCFRAIFKVWRNKPT